MCACVYIYLHEQAQTVDGVLLLRRTNEIEDVDGVAEEVGVRRATRASAMHAVVESDSDEEVWTDGYMDGYMDG